MLTNHTQERTTNWHWHRWSDTRGCSTARGQTCGRTHRIHMCNYVSIHRSLCLLLSYLYSFLYVPGILGPPAVQKTFRLFLQWAHDAAKPKLKLCEYQKHNNNVGEECDHKLSGKTFQNITTHEGQHHHFAFYASGRIVKYSELQSTLTRLRMHIYL